MNTEIDNLKKDISALTKTALLTSIIITTLFILTSCAWFGTANPHSEGLVLPPNTIDGTSSSIDVEVETPTTVEDVRG